MVGVVGPAERTPQLSGCGEGNPADGKDTALGPVAMKYFVFCDRGPSGKGVIGGLMCPQ